jgi:hypothetical protein
MDYNMALMRVNWLEDDNCVTIHWSNLEDDHWKMITCFWGRHDWLQTKRLVWDICHPEEVRLWFDHGTLVSVHLILCAGWYATGDGYKGYGMTERARRMIEMYCDEVDDDDNPYVYEWRCESGGL